MSRKWKILLACVVAVTAACAAAWYLLPRPAVGEDYEVQYINVGETLENITGQIDQNTCNALNDLLRQAERRGYRRNVFPRQLREDTVQIIGVDSPGSLSWTAKLAYSATDKGAATPLLTAKGC